jgi:hypothetical protein
MRPSLRLLVVGLLAVPCGDARAAGDLLIEMHYQPVPNVQLAIWLEDADGQFVADVLVTQATGKLGIGNRPGIWNFLSSWRAPYGPRPSVLPIWAHRRGREYPRITFHDDADHTSLGWHESSSSIETYFCRPLTPDEHAIISVDTMTCPSPNAFKSDKGRFDGDATSPYPPRNDLTLVHDGYDHPDIERYAELNDLDAVTAATPPGDAPEYVVTTVPADLAEEGPLTAWIEVNLEGDENPDWDFDREHDHYVDGRLANYGTEYLGQPSVVYRVDFDPRARGFVGTTEYAGYGDWDGASGTVHAPDATISASGGSGADRLARVTRRGETYRFGVFSYGPDGPHGDDDGWGECEARELPPVQGLALEPVSFDTVAVAFTVPEAGLPADFDLGKVRVHVLPGDAPLTADNLAAAVDRSFPADVVPGPGERARVEVDQLWGNYSYQLGVTYQDRCANVSPVVAAAITTPPQKFQQVEGFCFLATAAFGANWAPQVQALRHLRDAYLKTSPLGRDLVRFYYTYSPPLARVAAEQPLLRGMVRVVVAPVADLAGLAARR